MILHLELLLQQEDTPLVPRGMPPHLAFAFPTNPQRKFFITLYNLYFLYFYKFTL